MTRPRTLVVLLAVTGALGLTPAAGSSPPPRGALSALTGTGACLGPGAGCGAMRGTVGLLRLALSPDGRSLYASGQAGGLAVFARDPRSGRLHQLPGPAGCVRGDGSHGCARLNGFHDPGAIAVSGDGRDVYVLTATGIQAFTRNRSTGALHPLACLDTVRSGCGALRAPATPTNLLLAGANTVYLSGETPDAAAIPEGALAVLGRNPITGALRQLTASAGCLDADGSHGCQTAACIDLSTAMVLAHGGGHVYTGASDSLDPEATEPGDVATFDRNRATGALAEVGCRSRTEAIADLATIPRSAGVLVATLFGDRGTGHASGSLDLYRPAGAPALLRRVRKLACLAHAPCPIPYYIGPARLAVTPSGATAYVEMIFGGITVLHLGANGNATQLPGRAGCLVSATHFMPPPVCARVGPEIGQDMVVSPDGRNLYVGTLGSSNSQFYRGGVEAFAIAP